LAAPDVVLVGGGLIGLLTGAELDERGAHVTVLEKDDVGFEQSARSVAAVNLPRRSRGIWIGVCLTFLSLAAALELVHPGHRWLAAVS
jgi:glycine/D-amino acid oxidase-like deaminating enzyme